jgi:hypothetical protein
MLPVNGGWCQWSGRKAMWKPRFLPRQLVLAFVSVGAPLAGNAHHSFAMFDFTRTLEIAGSVKQFQWSNPHAWLDVIVTDPTGTQTVWGVEMSSPGALYREGWRMNSVTAGDKVVVVIHPLRDGRSGGSLVSATLPSGVKLMQAGPGAASQPPAGESKP